MDAGDLDDAALARLGLSRDSDVTLTADGRFLAGGAPFEHERLARAFAGWLERGPDGRYALRNGRHGVRLVVQGAPLHARRVEVDLGPDGEAARATLVLASGEREPLRPETLVEGPDGALFARVRPASGPATGGGEPSPASGDGAWPVRLAALAALDLSPWIVEGPALRLGGRSWPIRRAADPLAP